MLKRVNRSIRALRTTSLTKLILRLLPAALARPLRIRRIKSIQDKYSNLLAELKSIHAKFGEDRPFFIFPPSLDWDTQLFQRPQHLALALSRQGCLVFYCRLFAPRDQPALEWKQDNLLYCNVPIEILADFSQAYIYLLTWNREFARVFEKGELIYDYVDNIEVFEGDLRTLQREHNALVEDARLVLATAQNLYEEVRRVRPDVLLCPNGVEYERFSRICDPPGDPPPVDLAPILEKGKPIVGYYGALAVWFDYDLLRQLLKTRPDLSFVLIGPDYDGTLPSDLTKYDNLHWLGVKPYLELPQYLYYFDVAIIPFKLNDITHATSPLKLFEYLAACKPTVITPMQESMQYPSLFIANGFEEFSRRIDQALALKQDPAHRALMQQVAEENTWEARANQILQALDEQTD